MTAQQRQQASGVWNVQPHGEGQAARRLPLGAGRLRNLIRPANAARRSRPRQPGQPGQAHRRPADRSRTVVLRRASAAIRLDLDALAAVFDYDGHISLNWAYYTTYPYLARLRDRKVLEDGVLSSLDTPIDWQHQGFALADGWEGQKYGLVLPTDSAGERPATVGNNTGEAATCGRSTRS